ncbi:MAG: C1 family peptidase [Proteobacteria bacterium]|nr:C1 family peptidase [Pseudomonadota bacterium]
MKRISYTTTIALLLASAVLTTPVFAMQSQQLSLDQQLVSDIGLSPAAEVVTRPNGNLQSAPTFGEIAMVPVNLISRGLGALTQSALCAGGVKTVVKHDQPVSAFEAAAFNRINQTEEKLRQFAASAQEKGIDLDSPKLSEEELRYLAELAKRSGIKLEVGQQSFAIQGIGTTLASRQLDRRCPTVRAYDAAVEQRYANEKVYLKDLLQKIAEKDPKRLKLYVKENYELLKALDLNDKSSEGDKAQAFVARGLGVLPGTHAVVKCGYQYSILPSFAGFADKFKLRCAAPHYDLRNDSKVTKANFPMILNQGGTEACVAHAFSSALDFARRAQGLPNQTPSRGFIWSWTRQIGSSSHAFDGGAHKYLGNWGCSMNIAGDLVSNQGAPSEESDTGCAWHSDMDGHIDGSNNTMTRYDSSALSTAAHGETDVASSVSFIPQNATTDKVMNNVNAIKCALHSGYPVIIGIDVRRSSYYSADIGVSGDFVMPFSDADVNSTAFGSPVGKDADGKDVYAAGDFSVGGHAILIVGYDDLNSKKPEDGKFTFMNSWGTWWGNNGFGTLPYQYVCGTANTYKPAVATGHAVHDGKDVDLAPFKAAPYAGYFGQIKSLTK